MKDLYIIFGTGPLGRYTAEALLEMGKEVILINRSGKMDSIPNGAKLIVGDILNLNNIKHIMIGATSIYQCAQPEYHEWIEKFPALQRAILELSIELKSRLIVAENLYMYGKMGDKPFKETDPYRPISRKGQVRKEMTEELFDAHMQGKCKVASVRGSDFFGPYEPINGKLIFQAALQRKKVNLLGNVNVPHSFTYVKDFGKALALCGTDERALGKTWHVPSGKAYTQKEIVDLISQELGYKVKYQAAGKLILSIIGLFDKGAKEVIEMLYEFNSPFILDGSAMETTFGFKSTPMEIRIRETLEWIQSSK
ncbi:MAG TPA: NAD-dependent epimerase/dehydratase family protein [Leptospiraceae bacterium]|nr:NAD-dependent epimerase/dehydratase family protein [Leptospiraceae bacterium]